MSNFLPASKFIYKVQLIMYRGWNCRCAYLCEHHVILYFPYGKLLNVSVIPWTLRSFFFTLRRIFCENFKSLRWFGLLLKNKTRAEIFKHRNWDLHFCSFTVNSCVRWWNMLRIQAITIRIRWSSGCILAYLKEIFAFSSKHEYLL